MHRPFIISLDRIYRRIKTLFILVHRQRFIEEITLCELTSVVAEYLHLRLRFNALSYTFHSEFTRKRSNVAEHHTCYTIGAFAVAGKKTLVDLERVPGYLLD